MIPKYNLDELRALAKPDIENWISKTKALNPVVKFKSCSLVEATDFIYAQLQALELDNFSNTIYFDGHTYDVYGKRIEEVPWYIKFCITEDLDGKRYIRNISFHPTVKNLKTRCEELEAYEEDYE
ncbi:hypothetical protein ACES2L_10880 [Bdellovibrio bacteriovorus]